MHTLNRHPDNEYDIDTAVIFAEESLPADPLAARKRVAEALNLSGAPFSRDPEARTNAVTVWYAAGHHVDLAVYREVGASVAKRGVPIAVKSMESKVIPAHCTSSRRARTAALIGDCLQ
jgi:cyclic GMP-AMP synthase DncV-like protein